MTGARPVRRVCDRSAARPVAVDRCCWEDCNVEFDDPQAFFWHVDYHVTCHYQGERVDALRPAKCLWFGRWLQAGLGIVWDLVWARLLFIHLARMFDWTD